MIDISSFLLSLELYIFQQNILRHFASDIGKLTLVSTCCKWASVPYFLCFMRSEKLESAELVDTEFTFTSHPCLPYLSPGNWITTASRKTASENIGP